MTHHDEFATPQEDFWAGGFGTEYICRNESDKLLASNLSLFSTALRRAQPISSCVELGANIGMNLKALRLLYPGIALRGVEINRDAAATLAETIGPENVYQGSILDYTATADADLALAKTILIHIHPDMLNAVYDKLHSASSRYVLVCEYYNPTPMAIDYRGHQGKLFKRDFAGEMMDRHQDLRLIDYGFVYRHDPVFPQDDITWFLMEKQSS